MRAEIQKAIEYFKDSIVENDEIINGCPPALKSMLIERQKHVVVALAVLEQQGKEPCECCETTSLLAGYMLETGSLDIVFDVDAAQIDINLIAGDELNESINIGFCPMCGRELEG